MFSHQNFTQNQICETKIIESNSKPRYYHFFMHKLKLPTHKKKKKPSFHELSDTKYHCNSLCRKYSNLSLGISAQLLILLTFYTTWGRRETMLFLEVCQNYYGISFSQTLGFLVSRIFNFFNRGEIKGLISWIGVIFSKLRRMNCAQSKILKKTHAYIRMVKLPYLVVLLTQKSLKKSSMQHHFAKAKPLIFLHNVR